MSVDETNGEKEDFHVIKRFSPVMSHLPDLSPTATPVLEAYIENDENSNSKRMMAAKSKLFQPTEGSPITYSVSKNTEGYKEKRKKPPSDDINDLELPFLNISKSHSISPNISPKFKMFSQII